MVKNALQPFSRLQIQTSGQAWVQTEATFQRRQTTRRTTTLLLSEAVLAAR